MNLSPSITVRAETVSDNWNITRWERDVTIERCWGAGRKRGHFQTGLTTLCLNPFILTSMIVGTCTVILSLTPLQRGNAH